MRQTLFSIYSLLLAVAILLLGSGMLGTALALRAASEGFPTIITGIVMAGFFGGFLIGAWLCPMIIQRVGHIRTFSVMAAIGASSVLLHALYTDPLLWLLLRIVTGICMLGMYLSIESWLNGLTPQPLRGRVFGVYMTTNLLALGASQYLILLYGPLAIATFLLTALFFCLALVPVGLTRIREPELQLEEALSLHQLIRLSPLGVTTALVAGSVNGAFYAVGPLFGSGAGLDDRGVATLMSMIILGGALLQWPIGLLSDRHDRRLVIAIVAALAASAALLVFLTAGISRPALLPSAALFGGFAFSIYALGVAHTSDQLSPQQVLGAMRGLLLLNGIGATLGPLLASTMMSWLGHRSLMVYMAAILSLLMVVALVRITTSRPVPEEEKGEFVAMARTSPVALELDPRAELEPELDLNPVDNQEKR